LQLPTSPSSNSGWRISLVSFLILTLELAFIRLIPAEIKAISYFTNLLLFSSFFGLGLGCILHGRKSLNWLMPLGCFLLLGFLWLARGIEVYNTEGQVHYWLQRDDLKTQPFLKVPLFVAAVTVFILASIPFVALGQNLAQRMDAKARLPAYSWDILGSLLGTVVFAVSAWLGLPPWLWVIAVLWMFAIFLVRVWRVKTAFFVCGLAFLLLVQTAHRWKWSPYYFIQYEVSGNSVTVWVNSSFHQEAINFRSQDPEYQPVAEMMVDKFGYPYQIYRDNHHGDSPRKVLILGAGSGNDVNIALRNGAEDVTAVEIDPAIVALGREFNAGQPYQNPKVHVIIDDGRHFLWTTREQYDLIIFGTLDSQTLLSGQANLRLENYIYTTECFRDVKNALAPGGMMAAYYSVFKKWFYKRIYATVRNAFGDNLKIFLFDNNYLFNACIMASKGVEGFAAEPAAEAKLGGGIPSTDDWPYIYLERPTITALYFQVFGVVALCVLIAFFILKREETATGFHLDFFFLGVGFTLLEAAAIVRLTLAFGTTWIVSAIVFFTALLMIFLSNLLVMRLRKSLLRWAWAGVLIFLAINYLLPTQWLLSAGTPLRILLSILLIGSPVFCAGLWFSSLFATQAYTGYALGINLIGAMIGGLLEYASMLTGMRQVWLLIILVYIAALFASLGKTYQSKHE
jgi:SAM-dependent methyltransferase